MNRAQRGGYSLIEVLIALSVLTVAMGVAYGSVIAQARRQASQAMVSEAMYSGRAAMSMLTAQINNAGFGVPTADTPSAAATIITADPTKLSFWSSTTTAHTYLTAAAAKDARTVVVLSSAGIRAGASLYVASSTRWCLATVQSVLNGVVQLNAGLAYDFAVGSLAFPVEQVTFDLADGTLRRNGHSFIPNVSDLRFTYDSVVPSAVRVITVNLTVAARGIDLGGVKRTVTLAARVAPPNLVL
jgi:prepilin-type N-terminal cleavage/methylation domain-containing protein